MCTCGSPLLVEYDLGGVAGAADPKTIGSRPPTMWRYAELLPVDDAADIVSLGEGSTPLLPAPALADELGVSETWVKDDGLNPTGTFKARGASCGVTMARALGATDVALPTAGNAGGAWACYGAAAGLLVHVAMPRDAPDAARLECELFGADVTLVDGLISDAREVVAEGIRDHGWFDVTTLREPYRLEGKKTIGLEIAEQLAWTGPDVIVYPAGGGVGAIGIWRAFQQLRALGWIDGELPRMAIVQAEGCAPMVRAFESGDQEAPPWQDARTIAAGLRIPKALGDFLTLRAVRDSGGTALAVSDEDIVAAVRDLARDGFGACPEGAATLAGARRMRERGDLSASDSVVLVNTGTSLKYPDVVEMAAALDSPPH